jgi:aspartate 1-decarboxylase|tara:strand:- start:176 stop:406 length:231 start_codon:yes stop_codon:yes gene_type:complete
MKEVGIKPFEQIHIYNLTNGERLITYAIEAEAGSKTISMMGAAAHKANVGDLIIIAAYGNFEESEIAEFKPKILRL